MHRTLFASAAALLAASACNPPTPTATAEPAPSTSAAPAAIASATASAEPPGAAKAAPPPMASAAPALSPAEAAALVARAKKCMADPACPWAEADALYRRADDAGAKEVSCYDFYYGIGVIQDLPRARACFERKVGAGGGCNGSSPELERTFLAAMILDGQGGPADPARASGLFAGCFVDGTVQQFNDEVKERSTPSSVRKPLDPCDTLASTTPDIGRCHAIEGARIEDERRHVDRDLATKLDAEGKRLAAKANAAWRTYVNKEGEAYSDKYRDGTLRSNVWVSHENDLDKQRLQALAHLFDHALTPGADPAQAEKDMEKAFREARDGDAEHKKLFDAARRAWAAYRDAEIALYVRVNGDKLGKREVEKDVKATLTKRYQAELEYAILP